ALQQELKVYNIQIQTMNPGAYLTGFNETMSDAPFRWLDDSKNFTKKADLRATFDSLLGNDAGRLDPAEMIAAMVSVVPADTGKFRNVIPKFVEDMVKEIQLKAWDNTI
ncbi:MAG TPA: short-chain dehydrogenase, partial [Chitinophagaceae bacterium]|nr:short-chain dehydrogenase [Chitinophagaceae bacterium]